MKNSKMAIEKDNSCAMINYANMLKNSDRIEIHYSETLKYYQMAGDYKPILYQ